MDPTDVEDDLDELVQTVFERLADSAHPGEFAEADLRDRFNHHVPPNDLVIVAHEQIRSVCFGVAMTIVENVPGGRERAHSLKTLEEVMMWANAGIARNHQAFTEAKDE